MSNKTKPSTKSVEGFLFRRTTLNASNLAFYRVFRLVIEVFSSSI
jgi:hypothetical protein